MFFSRRLEKIDIERRKELDDRLDKLVKESEQQRIHRERNEKEKLEVLEEMKRGAAIEASNRRCVLAHEEAARESALAELHVSMDYETAEAALEDLL
jgi:hypothetical protein